MIVYLMQNLLKLNYFNLIKIQIILSGIDIWEFAIFFNLSMHITNGYIELCVLPNALCMFGCFWNKLRQFKLTN